MSVGLKSLMKACAVFYIYGSELDPSLPFSP